MNINVTVVCETCDQPTNCRIGMSNRDEQPFHFCCQTCGSPIDITLRKDRGGDFVGAHQLIPDLYPFDDTTNFVDLHLDFPVSFEKYVMGTPFMMAVERMLQAHNAIAMFEMAVNRSLDIAHLKGHLIRVSFSCVYFESAGWSKRAVTSRRHLYAFRLFVAEKKI